MLNISCGLKNLKTNKLKWWVNLRELGCRHVGTNESFQLDEHMLEKRKRFWIQENQIEVNVDYKRLNETEIKIHECHKEAVLRGHFTYDDPVISAREFTRLRHFLRGVCCGNACRHCIYDHAKVAEFKRKTRRFNTAFWTYDEDPGPCYELDDEKMFNLRKPKLHPT